MKSETSAKTQHGTFHHPTRVSNYGRGEKGDPGRRQGEAHVRTQLWGSSTQWGGCLLGAAVAAFKLSDTKRQSTGESCI